MSTSTAPSVFVLVLSGGGLLASAVLYVRGRDRAVILLMVPLQLSLILQSVGALFLSERGQIAAVIVSIVLLIPSIIQSIRMIRQHRATRPVVGP